jgi:hypothetical protein
LPLLTQFNGSSPAAAAAAAAAAPSPSSPGPTAKAEIMPSQDQTRMLAPFMGTEEKTVYFSQQQSAVTQIIL